MKKLKAFTLMELIIGMIVGSIVVGMCYSAYSMIFRQYGDYKKIKQQVNEAMRLQTALSLDFTKCELVEYKQEQLGFTMDSCLVRYQFVQPLIIRSEREVSDTFHFEGTGARPGFLEPGNEGIISSFSFEAVILGEKELFNYSKDYSAAFLMQHSKPATNGN
jgi:hypothetical protein